MATVDLSRLSTDFLKRYSGVRMQQGRVLTDDDFNDAAILDEEDMRRTRVDVIGPVGSPDGGFVPKAPSVIGGKATFLLGAGTLYLGGLCLEQPADEPFHLQKDWLNFDPATDWPDVPVARSRVDLVWIEAWKQPVSAIEDSEKLDAVLGGADTAQNVRVLRRIGVTVGVAGADCGSAWASATQAWAVSLGTIGPDMELVTQARLRVTFNAPPNPGDLCSPPVAGGYLGAENQAVRVQMVDPTHYTWGFDNAAPLYRVQVRVVVQNGVQVTRVTMLTEPKDAMHWPLRDQIVEVLPWAAALPNGETLAESSGHLARVTVTYNPDDQTFDIDTPLPAGFGTKWQARADAADFFDGTPQDDYFFLRVWNRGDDATSPPAIPIANGQLGSTGLTVSFQGGPLRREDFWIIGARPATPDAVTPWTLENASGAPPHGVKRYRAPLGLIRWTATRGGALGEVIHDCRPPFQPLTRLRGCCTVTVGDGAASFGMYTKIQAAIDALPPRGGTVCVLPGIYDESVVIRNRTNIVVHGCDARSRVRAVAAEAGPRPAFLIETSQDIGIERLGIEAGPRSAVEIEESQRVAVRECVIQMRDEPTIYASIFARGESLVIERNLIDVFSPRGAIAAGIPGNGVLPGPFDGTEPPPPLVLAHATRGGIQLGGGCDGVLVRANVIRGGTWNGITLGSLLVFVGSGRPEHTPDRPSAFDPCDPCRPVDTTDDPSDPDGTVRVDSAGDLYDIEICDNRIEHMGANGISAVRFFNLAKQPILVKVNGLSVHHNRIRKCLRRQIQPPSEAMQWIVAYGGIVLALASDLRIHDNEIRENGVDHLEPVVGIFAIGVEGLLVDRNRIADNGPRNEEPPRNAKQGIRGGVWIWFAQSGGDSPEKRRTGGASGAVTAVAIRDNEIVAPIGRPVTLFAAGPLVMARNRLLSRATTGRDLEQIATAVLLGNAGISNEWTLGLLGIWLEAMFGGAGINQRICPLAKEAGNLDPQTGRPWPPLASFWPTGKTLVTENQITSDTTIVLRGAAYASIVAITLDDLAFTDNQCEIVSMDQVFQVDAFLAGGSVRIADNRFSETWMRVALSAQSFGLMNTTTDNQSTHCMRADALPPGMLVFRDNLHFIDTFCPGECGHRD
jgi:hypothetical protein